jgi:twitching motility protein PilT
LIRDEKVHQIYSLIQAGTKYGMKTMNQSLMELVLSGQVAVEDVMQCSSKPEELKEMLTTAMDEKRATATSWRMAAHKR